MSVNLVGHIGSKVTVWTKDGNDMENRTLITVDEYGIVISPFIGRDKNHPGHNVFVPWAKVSYIDLPTETEEQPTETHIMNEMDLNIFSNAALYKELSSRNKVTHYEFGGEQQVSVYGRGALENDERLWSMRYLGNGPVKMLIIPE